MTLRIHMLGVLTFGIKMFRKVRSEYQCLERSGQNSSVPKDKPTILMFGKIRPEF